MPAKALIEVDMRIAYLRDQTARGQATAATVAELKELLKTRGELVLKIVGQRAGGREPETQ